MTKRRPPPRPKCRLCGFKSWGKGRLPAVLLGNTLCSRCVDDIIRATRLREAEASAAMAGKGK